MILMHDLVKLKLAQTLQKCLQTPLTLEEIYQLLSPPPRPDMGHYAFPCFSQSKTLKIPPPQVASLLKSQLDLLPAQDFIASSQATGPYLNFVLNGAQLGSQVMEEILSGEYFKRPLTAKSPRTMIEYSQPNTHKVMHVGHMRNLALGHSLVLLHRYCNYDIVSATFPGDMGTHVAKCLWYLKYRNKSPLPTERKGAWLGQIYVAATAQLENEKKTSPQNEQENRQQMTEILTQIEKKSGEFYDLWLETRKWSIDLMKEVYKWAGVEFDYWYFESDVDSDSLKLAQKYFEQGLLQESQGAIGMDLSGDDLGFCLLIKSDGTGLYATKDLELARRKFAHHGIEKSLYVVDVRQTLHFKQVFKVLEKMGLPLAAQCQHLAYDFVELPDGAMASRKGNIVPLQDLIDNMVNLIKDQHLVRYKQQWSTQEIEDTAQKVALGAINYGMLKIDPQKKIVFDMQEWLKLDGDSGPYLQYVCARISSMVKKLNSSTEDLSAPHWELLTHRSEEALMVKLSQFNGVVLSACEQYKTSHLCTYLYSLGKLYNNFYAECSLLYAESKELQQARLKLSQAAGMVMERGLELLGIPAPKRM